jgi:hypothetical protein
VRGWIEQHLMFVLAVQIDEPADGIAQRGAGDEDAVDEGAAASLRRHLAAHDHIPPGGRFEDRLHGGAVFAGAHEISAGPPSDEQPDGADEDGFSSACLAREHVESGVKLQLETVDDGQIGDTEIANHFCPRGSSMISNG